MLRKPSTKPCPSVFTKAANAVVISPFPTKPMPTFQPSQEKPDLVSQKLWNGFLGASASTKPTFLPTTFGQQSSTTPFPKTMETKPLYVSEMILLLEQCVAEFGDIPVGAYSSQYCYELGKAEDLMSVSLRVMTSYAGSSSENLPGIDLTSDRSSNLADLFLTIFYDDK